MNTQSTFDLLLNALKDLNSLLKESNLHIELTVVGSMAIYLNGLDINRMTEDIDYISYDPSEEFIALTERISKKYKLPSDWINSRAKDIEPLPKNIENSLKLDNRFSNINLKFINIDIAIQMKVYAYYIRGLEKDISDLKVLSPTKSQIEKGLEFTKDQIRHHHGETQLNKDMVELNSFLEFLYDELLK